MFLRPEVKALVLTEPRGLCSIYSKSEAEHDLCLRSQVRVM